MLQKESMKKFWMLLWIWGFRMDLYRKEKLLQKALFRISIMREWKKILHKWKEAGTFVPARMKKKNIIESSSPSMVYNIQ